MSRDEKIGKLARAVRIYRGGYDVKSGKWFRAPQRQNWEKVWNCLERLGITGDEQAKAMKQIMGFNKASEFQAWIRKLANPE